MSRSILLGAVLVGAVLCLHTSPASAEKAAEKGDRITWAKDLPAAFQEAKAKQRPILICVNAKFVAGRNKEEPAAKGLREVVYLDPRIVTKSRSFVCALLTPSGNSADYGELRALGIEGLIVSPQHIFVHADGTRVLFRKEYWSHGQGESGVKALLGMMDKALTQASGKAPEAEPEPPAPAEPEDAPKPEAPAAPAQDQAEARAAWIVKMLDRVDNGDAESRQSALAGLVKHDKEGDCIDPLIERIPKCKKKVPVLVDIIRALGVPGLEKAAAPIGKMLKHKEELVRGNAAVTLEYIGSKSSIRALKMAVDKEDNEAIASHMFRALGRCGPRDAKVRALLVKKTVAAKSTFATYGPIIGLAYAEHDKKTARAAEKEFKKMGHPFGRRGRRSSFKRALFMWSLSEIQDPKTGPWIRKEKMEPIQNAESQYKDFVLGYYDACAKKCELGADTPEDVQKTIDEGIAKYLGWRRDTDTPLQDEYRENRDQSKFKPKMEYEPIKDDNN